MPKSQHKSIHLAAHRIKQSFEEFEFLANGNNGWTIHRQYLYRNSTCGRQAIDKVFTRHIEVLVPIVRRD